MFDVSHLKHCIGVFQGVAVGENLVKLKYTTASAVKEKEGKLLCQAEVVCEGKANRHWARIK